MAKTSGKLVGRVGGWRPDSGVVVLGGHFKNLLSGTWREVTCRALAVCVGMFLVLPVMVMVGDRRPSLEILNMRVEPERVLPGQHVRIVYDANVLRPGCSGEVYRTVVDSAGRVFSYKPERTFYYHTEGRVQNFSREFTLPMGLHLGTARYRTSVTRWCNFLQEIIWPMREPVRETEFEVIAAILPPVGIEPSK